MKAFSFEVVHERTAFLASSSSGTENVMPFLIIEVKLLKRAKTAFSVTSVSCDLVAMFRRSATGLRDALVLRASVIFFSSSVTVLTEISPFFAPIFCLLRGGREAVDFGAIASKQAHKKNTQLWKIDFSLCGKNVCQPIYSVVEKLPNKTKVLGRACSDEDGCSQSFFIVVDGSERGVKDDRQS